MPLRIYERLLEYPEKVKEEFFNENHKKWKNFKRVMKIYEPKCLLILPKDLYHVHSSVFMSKIAKKLNPNIKIGIVGSISKYFYRFFLNNGADFVVIKDPFFTCLQAVKKALISEEWEKVPNIVYKKGKKFVFTKTLTITKDLDSFPLPNRELIIDRKYYSPSSLGDILASSGCIYKCKFCPIAGSKLLLRKPKNIVEEIRNVYQQYGTRDFSFESTSINLNRRWLIELCNEIKKERLEILWSSYANARGIDEPLAKLMKESGCWKLGIGFESGSSRILKKMNKPLSVEEGLKVSKILKKVGIIVYASFIVGYPGERIEDIIATLELIRKIKPDVFRIHLLVPKPGTPFFKLRKDNRFWEFSSARINIRYKEKNHEELLRELWRRMYVLSALQEKLVFAKQFFGFRVLSRKIREYVTYMKNQLTNSYAISSISAITPS
jgi:radical SAM superfamily enzyme YgiQ (UPF0313 family)